MKAATVEQAANAVLRGDLVAYPTEAVWGLGCNPFNVKAVYRLLRLKQRPVTKGLILIASQPSQVMHLLAADISASQLEQLFATQQQPTTWLVPINNTQVPAWIRGEHDRVAIRLSSHPLVQALCDKLAMPLVSTSANPAGCQPARHAFQARRYFGSKTCITQGRTGSASQPSMIKDLITQRVIRG